MKRALVTGATGQDGSYLCEFLLEKGYQVYGITRVNPSLKEHARSLVGRVEFLYGDMRDDLSLRTAIRKSWPDEIYNLAGQVFVPLSWESPEETFDVNVGGLARILKIVNEVKKDTKVYQASSSEMFGNQDGAFNETTIMHPTSPYGVSKYAAHKLVGLYRDRGMFVVAGILSNHESPRRGTEMVTRKIVKTVAAWAAGDESILSLGSLDSRRDWGFAKEYVTGMWRMLQQPDATDYVMGTGESHSVRDFLEEAVQAAGLSTEFAYSHLEIDQRLVRTKEIFDMRADNTKLRTILGWEPQVRFKELVEVMVRAELEKFGGGGGGGGVVEHQSNYIVHGH